MESIRNLSTKIKQLADNNDIVIIVVIILTSMASFGLGRLSKIEETRTPVKIYNSEQSASLGMFEEENFADVGQTNSQTKNSGEVVASKNGTKYYLPWCGGVKRISEANKVVFKNKEEAEKSGYTPAGNCKGL